MKLLKYFLQVPDVMNKFKVCSINYFHAVKIANSLLVYICEIVKIFLAGTRYNAVAHVIYITIKFLFLNPMNHVFLLY